jgi:hypothetical protein
MFVTFKFHQTFKRLTILIEPRLPIFKIWRVIDDYFLMLFGFNHSPTFLKCIRIIKIFAMH